MDYGEKSAKIVQVGLVLGALVFILVGFYLDNKFFPAEPQILLPWRIVGASIMITTIVLLGFKSLQTTFPVNCHNLLINSLNYNYEDCTDLLRRWIILSLRLQ